MDYIKNYYENYDEDNRLTSKHGLVEYITTQKIIHECAKAVSGKNILETAAGEWALREGLCPIPDTLEYALKVRRSPWLYKEDEKALEYAGTIDGDIQQYADVLEREMCI